ncbi:MAG: HD domain-containing protein [Halioglobus sp.]
MSNTVDVSDAAAVADAVTRILAARSRRVDLASLAVLFRDFSRLYSGSYPGFRACDVRYHDAQHVLDVTLAMARLLDGFWRRHPGEDDRDPQLALVGIAAALFHDSGYIRRTRDSRHQNGAAYTRVHITRGIRFVSEYLPRVGLQDAVGPCTRILHFTGYEVDPGDLAVADEREHLLGRLLGTADLIAQMADVGYAQKCRDYLYEEFAAGGLAGEGATGAYKGAVYRSPEQLLQQTPAFIRTAVTVRLDGHFGGVHHYAADHFDGRHLYMDAIEQNRRSLEQMLAGGGN